MLNLTYSDLTLPVPLLWLQHNAVEQSKEAFVNQLANAAQITQLLLERYVTRMWAALDTADVMYEDRAITSWLAVYSCIEDHHRGILDELLRELPEANSSYYLANTWDSWDLLSWHLLYVWLSIVFGSSAFRLSNIYEGDLYLVKEPEKFALAHADVALVMVKRGDPSLIASLAGQELAVTREFASPPPWSDLLA